MSFCILAWGHFWGPLGVHLDVLGAMWPQGRKFLYAFILALSPASKTLCPGTGLGKHLWTHTHPPWALATIHYCCQTPAMTKQSLSLRLQTVSHAAAAELQPHAHAHALVCTHPRVASADDHAHPCLRTELLPAATATSWEWGNEPLQDPLGHCSRHVPSHKRPDSDRKNESKT